MRISPSLFDVHRSGPFVVVFVRCVPAGVYAVANDVLGDIVSRVVMTVPPHERCREAAQMHPGPASEAAARPDRHTAGVQERWRSPTGSRA